MRTNRCGFSILRWRVLVLVAVGLIAGAALRFAGERLWSMSAEGGRQPFVATVLVKNYGCPQLVEVGSATMIEAFRADGSRATVTKAFHKLPDGKLDSIEYAEVVDLTMKQLVRIRPAIGAKITMAIHPSRIRQLAIKPDRSCGIQPQLGQADAEPSHILGFPVLKRTVRLASQNGEVRVFQEWVSPDLDCFVLRSITETLDKNGTVRNRNVTETAEVKVGPPDPSYFQVSENLKEMSPSQVMEAELAQRGRELCCGNLNLALQADRAYYENPGK